MQKDRRGRKSAARTVLRRRSAPTARKKAKRLRKQRKAQRPMEAGREVAKPPIGLEVRGGGGAPIGELRAPLTFFTEVVGRWEWEQEVEGGGACAGSHSSAAGNKYPRFGVVVSGVVRYFSSLLFSYRLIQGHSRVCISTILRSSTEINTLAILDVVDFFLQL
jgi:hypothetical protein